MKKIITLKAGFLPQLKTVMIALMEKDFSFTRSMEIARFSVNQLEREVQLMEQQRVKLCKDFAKKDDKGNPVIIVGEDKKSNYDIDDMETFQKKLIELSTVDVELEFTPFKESEFKEVSISPKVVMILTEWGFMESNQPILESVKEENIKKADSVNPNPVDSKNEIKI